MEVCDLFAYSQSYTCTWVFILRMKALEYQEYLVFKLFLDTDTIV